METPFPSMLKLNAENTLQNLKHCDGYLSIPAIICVSNIDLLMRGQ